MTYKTALDSDLDNVAPAKRHSAIERILTVLEFLFGCWHLNVSRPFTLAGWTYEVCLGCGKKFAYNRAEIVGGVQNRTEFVMSDNLWHKNHANGAWIRFSSESRD